MDCDLNLYPYSLHACFPSLSSLRFSPNLPLIVCDSIMYYFTHVCPCYVKKKSLTLLQTPYTIDNKYHRPLLLLLQQQLLLLPLLSPFVWRWANWCNYLFHTIHETILNMIRSDSNIPMPHMKLTMRSTF